MYYLDELGVESDCGGIAEAYDEHFSCPLIQDAIFLEVAMASSLGLDVPTNFSFQDYLVVCQG